MLSFGIIAGVAGHLPVFGGPGEQRFPKMNSGQGSADDGSSHEGNVGHGLEDDSGFAGGAVSFLGQILNGVSQLLQLLRPIRASDTAGPVAHTRLRSRWRG
jgi:hypothetical protein